MMDELDRIGDVVVVCDSRGAAAEAIRTYLTSRGLGQATWFEPHDAADVDRAVAAGRVRRVVWPDIAAWLTALWDGMLVPSHWQRPGLTVEFADAAGPMDTAVIHQIATAWDRWRARHRRRRAVAGLVLSIVALIAAFLVLLVSR